MPNQYYRRAISDIDRLMKKVRVDPETGCWMWTASISDEGYGNFRHNGQMRLAHRVSYELHVGPIPKGLVCDHKCHDPQTCLGGVSCPHRRCVRPDHINLVTNTVNNSVDRANMVNRRKTCCPKGHEYDYFPNSERHCRRCNTEAVARYRNKKTAIALEAEVRCPPSAAAVAELPEPLEVQSLPFEELA